MMKWGTAYILYTGTKCIWEMPGANCAGAGMFLQVGGEVLKSINNLDSTNGTIT
jgi:hypothetical protein